MNKKEKEDLKNKFLELFEPIDFYVKHKSGSTIDPFCIKLRRWFVELKEEVKKL